MTGPATFYIQRRIGEELLVHGWHASAIATRNTPGSVWALIDPSRRIRVQMSADFAAPCATITATTMPGAPAWYMVVGFASSPPVVAAALASVSADVSRLGTVRDRRAVIRVLATTGMHPDRSRMRRAFTGHGNWVTDDGRARATWTAPRHLNDGGWRITTATLLLDATATTPAATLTAALAASAPWNRTEAATS